ncbi:MAG: HAD family hydrolase [Dehalococcoidales bacterium]|jgi:putative hydrolase of the HAD superfamily
MKYQAVIFDLFGTLVDIFSQVEYYSVMREMMSVLKAPDDGFIKLWRDTDEKRSKGTFRTLEENLAYICRELNVPATASQINLAKRIRFDYIALVLTPRPGAIEVLSQLKSDGYKIGLISNCSTEPPVIWPYTPFAPFFDVTVFSSTSGLRKPDRRIYALAAEQLKVKPESCLYIGDGDSGELEGAARAGMHPVLIRDPDTVEAEAVLENTEPLAWHGAVITSLREIPGLLE